MPALQPKTGNSTPKGGKRKNSRDDDDSDDTENSDPEWSSQSPVKGKQSRKSSDDQPSMAESEETSVVPPPAVGGKDNDTKSGEVIFCGVLDFKAAKGQVVEDIAWEFSRLSALKGVPVRMVASSSCSVHNIIVTANGDVLTWGRGGQGQLGLGHPLPTQVFKPTLVKDLKKYRITAAATGGCHSLVLTSAGDVLGFGANSVGQLGVGNYDAIVSTPTRMLSKKIFVKISCGNDFSAVVDSKGHMYSCGNAENGRLGHGFPKEVIEGVGLSYENENRARRILRYIIKDPKTKQTKDIDDVKIVDVQCGQHHAVALDDQGRVFTWGFGGYGRLGHGSGNDEVFPRVVCFFLGENTSATRIWAGASSSLALSQLGSLLFWGHGRNDVVLPQYVDLVRKKTIKSVGFSNNSVMVAADDKLYTWSFGPTLGQMGLSTDCKSSSSGEVVPLPAGVGVLSVVCGHSFSLCIVGDKEAIAAGKEGNVAAGDKANRILDPFPVINLEKIEAKLGEDK